MREHASVPSSELVQSLGVIWWEGDCEVKKHPCQHLWRWSSMTPSWCNASLKSPTHEFIWGENDDFDVIKEQSHDSHLFLSPPVTNVYILRRLLLVIYSGSGHLILAFDLYILLPNALYRSPKSLLTFWVQSVSFTSSLNIALVHNPAMKAKMETPHHIRYLTWSNSPPMQYREGVYVPVKVVIDQMTCKSIGMKKIIKITFLITASNQRKSAKTT